MPNRKKGQGANKALNYALLIAALVLIYMVVGYINTQPVTDAVTSGKFYQAEQGYCRDADNGRNTETVSTVSGVLGQEPFIYTDSCINDRYVREYFCRGSEWKYSDVDCPEGKTCSEGRCVLSP